MRAVYTRGVGHTDNESAQHFDSEKLLQICLVLRTGFEPLVIESIGSQGRRSTNWATTSPLVVMISVTVRLCGQQVWNIFMLQFSWTLFCNNFQALDMGGSYWALVIHSRTSFSDLDWISTSRSQWHSKCETERLCFLCKFMTDWVQFSSSMMFHFFK